MCLSDTAVLTVQAPLLRRVQTVVLRLPDVELNNVLLQRLDAKPYQRVKDALTIDVLTAGGRADPPECTQNW